MSFLLFQDQIPFTFSNRYVVLFFFVLFLPLDDIKVHTVQEIEYIKQELIL